MRQPWPYFLVITQPSGQLFFGRPAAPFLAHEFGHTIGLEHTDLATEDHGFDTGPDSNTVVPQGTSP